MTFKIGDRIFVRGYIDEIRKDTVIVRNDGGYFGTILSEVTGELPSAQQEQRWIPCSERLPDKSGTYICNCVESDINHVTFIKWQSRYKRWDLNGRRTFWRVTAWKPIPEPWRGGQE